MPGEPHPFSQSPGGSAEDYGTCSLSRYRGTITGVNNTTWFVRKDFRVTWVRDIRSRRRKLPDQQEIWLSTRRTGET